MKACRAARSSSQKHAKAPNLRLMASITRMSPALAVCAVVLSSAYCVTQSELSRPRVQVTVLAAGLFAGDEMVLSPDLHDAMQAYLVTRCKDLGAIDKARVYKKSLSGVATLKLRLPDAAEAARARLARTVMITGMFTLPALAADAELPRVVLEDTLLKCQHVGVALAAEADEHGAPRRAVHVLTASAAGRVAVACASGEDAARCVAGFRGAGYAGVALQAAQVHASMWGAFSILAACAAGSGEVLALFETRFFLPSIYCHAAAAKQCCHTSGKMHGRVQMAQAILPTLGQLPLMRVRLTMRSDFRRLLLRWKAAASRLDDAAAPLTAAPAVQLLWPLFVRSSLQLAQDTG